MTQSLKSRLMYGMITGMTVLLMGFDLIIYHSISRELFNQFDSSLESAANLLSASVEQDDKDNKFDFEFNIERIPTFTDGKKPAYYELRSGDGTVIKKSPSLDGDDLIMFEAANKSHTFKSFVMKNGRPVRAVAINFLPHFEDDPNAASLSQPLILTVAYDAGHLLSHLRFLKYLLSITSAGILILAYAVAQVVVSRGLLPLCAIAAQIDGINEDNLKNRIAGENLPAEIVPIQRQLNNLLAKLEASLERERAFNTNVAHELRTPLAGIRSIIDVTLTRDRNAAEYRSALSETLAVINDIQTMVTKLLELARTANGRMVFNAEQIKPAELADKCWQPFSGKAAEAKIVFENRINKNLVWKSDATALSIIFSNLLNNAAEYTNPGVKIQITSQKINTGIEIIFKNTSSQLTEQQAETVFDCYWRADASRSGTGTHFGLGLALVKQLTELLGGKIRAAVSDDLFSIHICLPLA